MRGAIVLLCAVLLAVPIGQFCAAERHQRE
jgi:hypothetical protein